MLGSVRLVICMHTSYKFTQKFPMMPFNRDLVSFASFLPRQFSGNLRW